MRLPIVVRVFQLSLSNRSLQVAKLIGNNLGWFVEVPKEADTFYTPYFRIKILVDVTTPLKRGLFFQGVEGSKQWLPVAYERLPTYCFLCGILGHGEVNCPKRYEEGFIEPEGNLPYGSWLRAVTESKGAGASSLRVQPNYEHGTGSWSTSMKPRIGSGVFEFGVREKKMADGAENMNPNAANRITFQGGIAISSFSPSSIEKSGENEVASGRRKVKAVSNKRKATEAALVPMETVGKKPQFQLRDMDINSTAEVAAQSRRAQ